MKESGKGVTRREFLRSAAVFATAMAATACTTPTAVPGGVQKTLEAIVASGTPDPDGKGSTATLTPEPTEKPEPTVTPVPESVFNAGGGELGAEQMEAYKANLAILMPKMAEAVREKLGDTRGIWVEKYNDSEVLPEQLKYGYADNDGNRWYIVTADEGESGLGFKPILGAGGNVIGVYGEIVTVTSNGPSVEAAVTMSSLTGEVWNIGSQPNIEVGADGKPQELIKMSPREDGQYIAYDPERGTFVSRYEDEVTHYIDPASGEWNEVVRYPDGLPEDQRANWNVANETKGDFNVDYYQDTIVGVKSNGERTHVFKEGEWVEMGPLNPLKIGWSSANLSGSDRALLDGVVDINITQFLSLRGDISVVGFQPNPYLTERGVNGLTRVAAMFTELKELSGGEIVPTVVLDDDGNIVETHDFTDIIGGAVAPVKFDVTLPVKVVYIDVYDPSIKTLPPIAHDIFYHGWAVKDSQLVYILGTSPNQNIKYLAGMLCLSAIESLNREYAKTNFSEELQNSVSAKLWESWFGMTTQDMTREGADLRSPVTPLPIQ